MGSVIQKIPVGAVKVKHKAKSGVICSHGYGLLVSGWWVYIPTSCLDSTATSSANFMGLSYLRSSW